MHVLKFGGTSMGDEHTWRQVIQIIKRYEAPFVIVSATARTTRQLLGAAEQAFSDLTEAQKLATGIEERHRNLVQNFLDHHPKADSSIADRCDEWITLRIAELREHLTQVNESQKLPPLLKDAIASIGEQLSSYLFAQCGRAAGLPFVWVDATEIIQTDSDFTQANPDLDFIERAAPQLINSLEESQVPVMGGFYGQNENGKLTTLGFEGSDYTASLIGAALGAEAIEIWTDVSGIYTSDPRVVSGARPISQLSFQEATELAYFGAKVLHPSTTKPAAAKQISVWVKNIFDPDQPGTRISGEATTDGRAKAITFKRDCTVVTVNSAATVMGYEFLSGIFDTLRYHHLAVDVVTTTEASVSIAIEDSDRLHRAVKDLQQWGTVSTEPEQGIISLVACNPATMDMLIKEVTQAVDSKQIQLLSISKSKGNLNLVMPQELIKDSVQAIHDVIFRSH